MKKILLSGLLSVCFCLLSWSQCDLTLQGDDTFGDGWNGGFLTVTINGTPTDYAVAASTDTWVISVNEGDEISMSWTAGGFLGEVSWSLTDNTSSSILSSEGTGPASGTYYEGIVTCATCAPVDYPILASTVSTSEIQVAWTDNSVATDWKVYYRLASDAVGTETIIPVNVAGTGGAAPNYTFDVTGLPVTGPGQDYVFYVATDCMPDTSILVGPAAASTNPNCIVPTAFSFVNGTGTTAEFTWNAGVAPDFIIEYGTTGFTPGTFPNTLDVVGATSATVTGLTSGTTYDYYIYSNCGPDTSTFVGPITELATCAIVTDFTFITADNTSGQVSWSSTATDFILEYGLQGFTEGSFTDVVNVSNDTTGIISGLVPNSFYDVYVYNDCGVDSSVAVGPITFNTYNQGEFMEFSSDCPAGGFIDISSTGTDLGLTDDSEATIDPLPFPVLFQQVIMNNVSVGNNGGLVLGTPGANVGSGGNFNTLADGTIFPWGDDLDDESGNVYAEVIGTAPNRIMIVQWDNICNFSGSATAPTVTFQVQIEETTNEIYFVYDDVVFGGSNSTDDFANNASIGLSGPTSDLTVSDDDPQYLMDNSCVHFYYTDCPKVEDISVVGYYTDTIIVSWNPGVAGETNWTVEYGPAGFTPGTGTSFTTTNTQDTIGGLTQLTDYDVYIYADCDVALQSFGNMISTQTAPVCTTPTGVTANALQDSIGVSWMWTGTTVASTGFNIQYGLNGAGQYGNNTTVAVDNNLNDTILDNTLLGGTLYDVYVQAVCGTDTSLYAGPFTIVTPLTNDTTCSAIGLNVDGTIYNFNNSGATVGVGETNIAPPNTGANEIDGWVNSTLNNTTWFTFVAPASGNVYITGQDQNFAGQMAVYSVTDCGDYNTFTLEGANDNAINGGGVAPGWVQCGLTAGNTYYLMHDGNSNTTGNYSIRLEDVDLSAGSFDTPLEACSGDTVDLFTAISGQDAGGDWIDYANTFQLNGSIFATTVLATGVVYDFEYRVTRECAYDSVIATVEIYGPSQAGEDGSMTVCLNETIGLFTALSGTVDVGGTWYDPSDVALPNATPTASNIPGQFNYDYIVGNGVCPDDTSLVVITVDGSCDALGLEDMQLEGISIFPNPASEILTIASNGSHEALNVQVVDVNGRVVYTSNESVLVGSTLNIDVTAFETGVYILRLYNNEVENTFRVVVK